MERKHASSRTLTAYKASELLFGTITYSVEGYVGPLAYSGYGDRSSTDVADFISEEMRNDWRANRKLLLDFWNDGDRDLAEIFPDCPPWLNDRGDPNVLPWAAEMFDDA